MKKELLLKRPKNSGHYMKKIFLAEDDQTMVALLQTLLKLEGYEVVTLDVANEGLLSILRNDIPQILLLDVKLPQVSGMDIVREMRQDEKFNETKVIMSSGMSLEKECIESGADAFLLKPYMPDDLIRKLRNYS